MKAGFMKIAIQFLLVFTFSIVASDAQESLPDSLLIGNLDGSDVIAGIGQPVPVPIWAKTDDSVAFMQFSIATSDEQVSSRDRGIILPPLALWDQLYFSTPYPSGTPGYTTQDVSFYADTIPPFYDSGIFLDTDYQWIHIADYFMTITVDTARAGEISCMVLNDFPEIPLFGMYNGLDSESPGVRLGCLRLINADYLPGDVNNNGNVNGLDVVYFVNYLRGQGPIPFPLQSADANGDCLANGLDVIYLVNYLKGIGSLPRLGDCD